ncbi:prepilin peptidase [Vulgatibacter sp.]|uniref:A24 family peptidase n=1 Tax=Vulgatibacter sp. TaxID=1971226 RepID=UPI003569AA5E
MAPEAAAWVLGALLLGSLGVSLVTDLRARRIPNAVTLPAFALALLARGLLVGWEGPYGLGSGLVGAVVAFAPFFLLAWMGGMGMGDVKLAAVVGACVGWERILAVLFCIALVGGVQGVIALLWSRLPRRQAGPRTVAEPGPQLRRVTVPYGVAIAFGTAWALVWPVLGS